ncbi:serine hydrolase [Pontibacter mangrovi]|uniref:Serine hydrolase n=2 Tax=Pontibacter mangrovi TaxID=2589816 RepID=A0A501WH35_9BACT|nr:serine hydrolase [Pontibacter mangrovi]
MAQQVKHKKLVQKIMKRHPDQFREILKNPEKYRVQILYTQIDRDAQNDPHFTSYTYRVDPKEYFYPASTVKLPAAALALEKLNELDVPGLDKEAPMRIDSAYAGQSAVQTDSSARNNLPSIAHYIKKVLLVSDNDAYNRLYEFLGQEQLNEGLHEKGFEDVRLSHRLSIFLSPDENSHTNPMTFYRGDSTLYSQPMLFNAHPKPSPLKEVFLGKGYYKDGKLVNEPMDFSAKNYISVEVLQGILKSILFPEAVPAEQRFNLTPEDYAFLYKYMSMLPRESDYPAYDPQEYPDSYVKFLMFGNGKERLPENIRIFNKIGDAYGFMIDNAYIVDFENKVEFMLTAVIYVDEDQIFNDDKALYEEVGFPFMKNLGQAFYKYELDRKKEHLPDLSRFKFTY